MLVTFGKQGGGRRAWGRTREAQLFGSRVHPGRLRGYVETCGYETITFHYISKTGFEREGDVDRVQPRTQNKELFKFVEQATFKRGKLREYFFGWMFCYYYRSKKDRLRQGYQRKKERVQELKVLWKRERLHSTINKYER